MDSMFSMELSWYWGKTIGNNILIKQLEAYRLTACQSYDNLRTSFFKLMWHRRFQCMIFTMTLKRNLKMIYSVFELAQQFLGVGEGNSGLSVLRTFRLLRILKLVRFMPNLRRQLFVMLRTMDNVAIFFSLLILFIFIFR